MLLDPGTGCLLSAGSLRSPGDGWSLAASAQHGAGHHQHLPPCRRSRRGALQHCGQLWLCHPKADPPRLARVWAASARAREAGKERDGAEAGIPELTWKLQPLLEEAGARNSWRNEKRRYLFLRDSFQKRGTYHTFSLNVCVTYCLVCVPTVCYRMPLLIVFQKTLPVINFCEVKLPRIPLVM